MSKYAKTQDIQSYTITIHNYRRISEKRSHKKLKISPCQECDVKNLSVGHVSNRQNKRKKNKLDIKSLYTIDKRKRQKY